MLNAAGGSEDHLIRVPDIDDYSLDVLDSDDESDSDSDWDSGDDSDATLTDSEIELPDSD